MHEQSETIQRPDGRWINIYGSRTPSAGQQLPGTADYATVDEAVTAAKARSNAHGRGLMDVRLPDGTIVTNVPEGTTQEELAAALGKGQFPQEASREARLRALYPAGGSPPPVGGASEAALIAAGRSGDKIAQGNRQFGLSANVAAREALGMQSGDQLRALAEQEAQQKENDRLYAPLKKDHPIATAFGEAAPAVGVPLGAATVAGRVLTPTVGMMALEASKYGTQKERAVRGAAAGAAGLAGGVTSELLARGIMPIPNSVSGAGQNTIAELAANVGARPLPSQLANSPTLARYEDMLARSPGGAGPMGDFMRQNQEALNSKAAGTMGEAGNKIDASMLAGANRRLGGNFNALRQNATMPSSQQVFDAIDDAKALLQKGNARAEGKPEALKALEDLKDALYNTKQLSGDDYKTWVSDLSSQARASKNETIKYALKKVQKAMDKEATANTAPTVDANGNPVTWDATNKEWAGYKALLKPNVTNEVTGDMNAAAYARGVAQDMKGREKLGGSGDMRAIYEYGRGVPQLRAGSPTFERKEADSFIGMAKAAPRYAAAKALTSPAFSEYLTKGALGTPGLSEPMSLLAARAAFPMTAGLTDAQLYALLMGLPVVAEK